MLKKVLILTDSADQSSSDVIKWLRHYKISFHRLNDNVRLTLSKLLFDNINHNLIFEVNNKTYNVANYSSYWYRRGSLELARSKEFDTKDDNLRGRVRMHLNDEEKAVLNFMHRTFENRNSIDSFINCDINKLETLLLAKQIGLNIPITFICSSKMELEPFLTEHKTIITKGLENLLLLEFKLKNEVQLFSTLTEEINLSNFDRLPDFFFPSKFQNKIIKHIELIVFFLDNTFYSMAIFSQNNIKTEIDFRNYDHNNPNRGVPFKLPRDIEKKLTRILNQLKLTSASLDLILDTDGKYIFLEVNPIGQFGMVSYPCNYYLEQKIAKKLSL